MNTNNCINEVYSSFNKLHKELSLGFCLMDNFPNCLSFHIVNQKDKDAFNNQICLLNKLINDSSSNPKNVLVIADTGIKNNITTSILHFHSSCNILVKTIHHATNITSTKAELLLLLIRCSIN